MIKRFLKISSTLIAYIIDGTVDASSFLLKRKTQHANFHTYFLTLKSQKNIVVVTQGSMSKIEK